MKAPRFFDEGIYRAAPNFGLHSFFSNGHTELQFGVLTPGSFPIFPIFFAKKLQYLQSVTWACSVWLATLRSTATSEVMEFDLSEDLCPPSARFRLTASLPPDLQSASDRKSVV